MATSKNLIEIRGLSKAYYTSDGDLQALSTIDLDIQEREFVAVLGPSGCGKSTLLMLISGLLPATTGTITINGLQVRKPYTDLGIVFQQDVLLDWRTVLDNVMLQSEIRRLQRAGGRGPDAQRLARRHARRPAAGVGLCACQPPVVLAARQ